MPRVAVQEKQPTIPPFAGKLPVRDATRGGIGKLPKGVPNIIEFVVSDRWLNKPNLYPRQAALLKTLFLQQELMTDYDLDLLGHWAEQYRLTGQRGVSPDIFERMRIARDEELRPWFRESVIAMGRRGSKGYLGALAGAYVLWTFMQFGDPQRWFGVDPDKRLTAMVFAYKKQHARDNQWRDLVQVIRGAPCYEKYISQSLAESMTIWSPHDSQVGGRREQASDTSMDLATFEIVPKESTAIGGRGPASFMLFFDEMAWMIATGASRSAQEVYDAAVPSLDQFREYGFLWEPSSPWQRSGQFYDNYLRSTEIDEETHKAAYPEIFMAQMPSWDIYRDWEYTGDPSVQPLALHILPDDRKRKYIWFNQLMGPIQTYDTQMRRLERANPQTFRVERRAHFAAVLDAYLSEKRVDEIFLPWPTEDDVLTMQHEGILARQYYAHGDPSKSGANFGFAIAHTMIGEDGLRHVVFDLLHAWMPSEYEYNDYEIDYDAVEVELKEHIDRFMPREMSFDQWNSVGTIQRLRKYVTNRGYPKQVQIFERTATQKQNWKVAETFKTAIGLHLVHAPYFELAELELKYLQDLGGKIDHPDTGPVTTKDVSDCMMILTNALIGDQVASLIGEQLGEQMPVVGLQGGARPFPQMDTPDQMSPQEQLSSFGATLAGAARGRHLPASQVRRTPRGPVPRRRGRGGTHLSG